MRVLFIGSTRGTATSLHYFTAFSRLGHQVIPYDPDFFTPSDPIDRILMRVRKGPSETKRRAVQSAIVELCRNNRFDVVFVMSENFLTAETLDEVRAVSDPPPLFLYHSHDNNFSEGILKPKDFFSTLALYDAAYTTKSQNVARYQSLGCRVTRFIPSAYEPTVHFPVPPKDSRVREPIAACFVGTFDRSRPKYLEAVGWENLRVWGSGWERWEGYAAHRAVITPRPIYYFELADVTSQSRVVLGILRDEAEDLHTQRTFEIPACGALQIAPRNDEILSFFREDSEIVCFSTLEELGEKTRYYLAHPEAARAIARAGYQRCISGKHSYMDRVAEMLRIAFETRAAQSA